MKILTPILAIIIGILLIFAIGKNVILKTALEAGVKSATGLQLTIGKINLDFVNTLIEVKDLTLYNPKGYPDKVMCEVPHFYLALAVMDFFKGLIHIKEATLEIKDLYIIKDADGNTNVNALKPVKEQKEEKEQPQKAEEREKKEAAKPIKLLIDTLNLKIGQVVYKDYTKPGPYVKEYNLNLNETHRNITDPKAVVSLIMTKALLKTGLSELSDLSKSELQDMVKKKLGGQALSGDTSSVSQAMSTVAEKFKGLF